MKTTELKNQKFFNVRLVFTNQNHLLGRNVVEAFLQHFFGTKLTGRDLALFIGDKELHIVTIGNPLNHKENWWKKTLAVKKIR